MKCALAYSSLGGRSIALGGTDAVVGAIAIGASTLSYVSIGCSNQNFECINVACCWFLKLFSDKPGELGVAS